MKMPTPKKTQPVTQKNETRAPSPVAAARTLSTKEIATRAYEIWQASGRPHGRDQEHWFQAERELRSSPQASRSTR